MSGKQKKNTLEIFNKREYNAGDFKLIQIFFGRAGGSNI